MAMSLSLAVSAGAAFNDQDKIVNTEAVDMCVALNIINGRTNGDFDPAGNVTRAEAAKMICIALNGGKEPTLSASATPIFADIAGHWAAKYIEYCVSEGIVAGKSATSFDPNGNVTGVELAKMLLIALGYNAEHAKFLGANWDTNVNVVASQKDLYEELETIDPSVALSRDNAAQMIWNALQAFVVEYDYTLVSNNGTLTSQITVGDKVIDGAKVTLLEEKYGATVTDPAVILQGVELDSKGTYSLTTSGIDCTKVEGNYVDLLGQAVKVVYKASDEVLGVFATTDNQTVSALVNEIEAVDATTIEINDVEYDLAPAAERYTITDGVYASGLSLAYAPTSMNTFTLIDNDDDDKYEGAVITTVAAAQVTYASADEVIAGGVTYKAEDHNIADGIAKDDYVTAIYNIADDCYDIAKVEAVTGEVDGAKNINGTACARVNGEWYIKNSQTLNIDSEYTFYAVNGVVIAGSVDASSADIANLIMVLDTDTYMKKVEAMVMYADGTTETVTIDTDGATPTPAEMYTYTETEDGYKLTAAATIGSDYAWTLDGTVAAAGSPAKIATIDSKDIADDAVIYVYTTDGGKVITGKQLKNLADSILGASANQIATTASGYYVSEVKGLDRVTYAGVVFNGKAADLGVTNGNEVYAYVTSDYYTVSDSYTTYTIWNGTENLTVIDKDANTFAAGTVLTYDSIDNGYIAGAAIVAVGDYAVQGIEGDYLFLDGKTALAKFEITSDTEYLYIDSNADAAEDMGKTSGTVALADKFGGTYRDNVLAYINGSNEIELLIVDVKNDMTTATNATRTATIADAWTFATETLSVVSGIKAGDAIEVTIEATNDGMLSKTLALTNAKTADEAVSVVVPALANGATYTFTVFATGAGNVAITVAP